MKARIWNSQTGHEVEVTCQTQFEAALLETLDRIAAALEAANAREHARL